MVSTREIAGGQYDVEEEEMMIREHDTRHKLTHALHKLTHALHKLTNALHKLTHSFHRLTHAFHKMTHALHKLTHELHKMARSLHRLTQALHKLTHALHKLARAFHRMIPGHADASCAAAWTPAGPHTLSESDMAYGGRVRKTAWSEVRVGGLVVTV